MTQNPHLIDIYAGKKLRELRQTRNVSQADLGSMLEKPITFQQVQKYEKGTNRMALSRVYEFATILEVSISAFLPESDQELPPLMTRQEHQCVQCLRLLPKHCRASMVALLKELGRYYGELILEQAG